MKSYTLDEKLQLLTKFMKVKGDVLRKHEYLSLWKSPLDQSFKVVVRAIGNGFTIMEYAITESNETGEKALRSAFEKLLHNKQNITSWS